MTDAHTAYRDAIRALLGLLDSADPYTRHLAQLDVATMREHAADLELDLVGNAPRADLDGWDNERLDHGAHDDAIYSGREWASEAEMLAAVYGRPSRRACRDLRAVGQTRGWAHRGEAERFAVVEGPTWDEVSRGMAVAS